MKKAFTLVEMLVAIVLLTLLIGVALFSFRLQLISVTKMKLDNMQKVLAYTQLKSSVESMKYYLVQEYDQLNLPIKYQWHYFFDGTEKTIRFVTQNPLFAQEDALVQLECSGKKLIYREEPLYGRIDFLRPAFIAQSRRYTLYDNLDHCRFAYITRKNRTIKHLKNDLPSAVQVTVGKEDFFIRIKADNNLTKSKLMDRLYDEG